MSLRSQQYMFAHLVSGFLAWCFANGYEITLGEAYRTPEQAAWNRANGKGIGDSLHTQRLAIDLNLFINGVYQTDSAAYKPLGDHWKSLNVDAAWGGDFSKPDGNHFSLSFLGRK